MTFPALEAIQSPLPDRKPNAYTDPPADTEVEQTARRLIDRAEQGL